MTLHNAKGADGGVFDCDCGSADKEQSGDQNMTFRSEPFAAASAMEGRGEEGGGADGRGGK